MRIYVLYNINYTYMPMARAHALLYIGSVVFSSHSMADDDRPFLVCKARHASKKLHQSTWLLKYCVRWTQCWWARYMYIYIDSWNSWNVKSPSPNARAWRTYALPGHEWLIVLLWHIFVETWLDSTPWWADFLEIKVAMGNLLPLLPRASQHYPRVFVQVQKK